MPTKGKKYTDATRRFDREQLHSPGEAVDLVKRLASAGFDETVELAVRLGVDPRRADQIVRGTVALPAGTGKAVRVAVFAAGEAAAQAREAGADVVGADDLVARVQGGVLDFDVAVATTDQMGQVGKITKDQVREIATTKMPDLNARDIDAAMKIIEGTARSMGVTVDG